MHGVCIRTSTTFSDLSTHLNPSDAFGASKTIRGVRTKLKRKAIRRRIVRTSLLMGNGLILIGVLIFMLQNQHGHTTSAAAISSQQATAAVANPLDQLSSADIAATAARMVAVPETNAINNQAVSQAFELTVAPTNDSVVAKPQVVSTALKSKADIQTYAAVAGDTLSSVATKFGVTSDSIRWSNDLASDTLTAGQKLVVPPVNGIVYSVVAGDTPDSIAQKFKANKDKIVAFNDGEINGFTAGEQIVVPDGTKAAAVSAKQIVSSNVTGYAWGGNGAIYGSNGYDYGYCTWYVATRISVPANWGNANTWDNLAPLSGWTVSSTPVVGAVAQTDAGYEGHVAYVEAVSDDGTMMKYSDMNGLAGFGRVGYSDWVSISKFPHYIYR